MISVTGMEGIGTDVTWLLPHLHLRPVLDFRRVRVYVCTANQDAPSYGATPNSNHPFDVSYGAINYESGKAKYLHESER